MRKLLFVLPLLGIIASGCVSAQAKDKPVDRPALNVPPPPPRIVEPAEAAPEPVAELPPVNPTASPRPSRPAAPKPAAERPEVKTDPQAEVSPKPESSKPLEAKAEQLRTPETADTSGAARTVRATIDTARGILNTVNFGPLSNERKKAYNDVKLFLRQAEDALKQGNLAYAQGVANKAETLAKELAGR
jgi:outer membrane biosynthesis protein TonB